MAFKILLLSALVALASAQYYSSYSEEDYHHSPAEYKFEYSVHDYHTGDIKSQQEERHGDSVKGQYALIDADGHRRVVDYSSDKYTGFIANVRREPIKGNNLEVTAPKKIVQYVKPALVQQIHYQPIQQVHLKPIGTTYSGYQALSQTSFSNGNAKYQHRQTDVNH